VVLLPSTLLFIVLVLFLLLLFLLVSSSYCFYSSLTFLLSLLVWFTSFTFPPLFFSLEIAIFSRCVFITKLLLENYNCPKPTNALNDYLNDIGVETDTDFAMALLLVKHGFKYHSYFAEVLGLVEYDTI